jgi:DNA-binding MarR family transcriptional regulator
MGLDGQKLSIYEIAEIFEWISIISQPTNASHDYGDGRRFTTVEIHTISYIGDHPGCTVTEIAKTWMKTKSAVSQLVKKLRKQGLVVVEQDQADEKQMLLRLTPSGKMADALHRRFDEVAWERSLGHLKESFSEEEINNAFLVIREWVKWRTEEPDASSYQTILDAIHGNGESGQEETEPEKSEHIA